LSAALAAYHREEDEKARLDELDEGGDEEASRVEQRRVEEREEEAMAFISREKRGKRGWRRVDG